MGTNCPPLDAKETEVSNRLTKLDRKMEDSITTKLSESSIARALGEHYTKMGDHDSAAECFAEADKQLTDANALKASRQSKSDSTKS